LARKILLADDSVTAQNMGRKILADAGYEVIAVNNGSAALKKIAELKPDIIILDVYMPGYSGLEVCQRLKEAQETSRIPVLLTVGKLEPFKPEEAKRVRAEGYIVKPFEASELLSTLSKLEDKIVPRAEPSKPGRFARANAAIDEGRYDKAVQTEEDSGWKNRIGFPSKKKKATEDDGDDSTIYNAVNKDLRTVVDRKPGQPAPEVKAEDSRFDLGALAPEGLPKDVTPEEIAALAAAAAQVGGAFADAVPEQPATLAADEETAAAKVAEAKTAAASAVEKVEAKEEAQPVAELPKESPAATFAQKVEEVEAATAKAFEAVKEGGVPVPSATEMMAAIAGLVPEPGKSTDSSSENGSGSHGAPEHDASADVPTMAAAAGFGGAVSRWTAVAVALAPDEAAISLENEMQKAHAAFAAAEVAHTEFVAPVPVVQSAVESAAPAAISSPVEAPAAEVVASATTIAAPETPPAEVTQAEVVRAEVAQSIGAVAGAAAEALSGAVKEFERVAASYEPQPPLAPSTPEEPKPTPVEAVEPVAQSAPETPQAVEGKPETKIEENPIVEAPASQPEAAKTEVVQDVPAPVEQKEQKQGDVKQDAPRLEEAVPVAEVAATAVEEKSAISTEQPDIAAPIVVSENPVNDAPVNETRANETSVNGASAGESSTNRGSGYRSFANEPAADPTPIAQVSSETALPDAPAAAVTKDTPKGESEIAETTAAAWASWRRIRESGDSKTAPSQPAKPKEVEAEPTPVPQDEAAMAVAAGAEKSPEDVAAPQETPDIANMVDSVLAGLRPQIVEEISRKLGKKK
jgi:CheY-like chemotaxis protein